jgi:polyhydroxyalkanoate synthesis regulator phasin
VYGFREANHGKVLNWDLLHKNDMDIFFERAETFHAMLPFYGIKTDINPVTGYIRRGKPMKDAVDEFYKKVCDYSVANGLPVPPAPEFACVLEGDLNYNLEMYSIEELKYDGIKSTVYIEVAHSTATEEQLTKFVKDMVEHICAMEKMEPDDFAIKNYSNSEIEYAEQFERLLQEDMSDDVNVVTNKMHSVSLDDVDSVKTMMCFKLVFRHDHPKQAWAFMAKILLLKTHSEEHTWDPLMLNGSYVYIHNRGQRAQVGNVWLNEGTIIDTL